MVAQSFPSFSDDLESGYEALQNRNYPKALYYLSYYAVLGDPKAQYNLGIMYNKGFGVEVDKKEAVGWFLLSAEHGNMLAQYALGYAYYKGEGVLQNFESALRHFKNSAFQGHPSSQVNIGKIYFLGQGIEKSLPKAHMWWRIAEEKGLNGAYENIIMVEKIMSDKELTEAINLYNDCQKKTLPNC